MQANQQVNEFLAPEMRPQVLYRHYDKGGALLYIGVSCSAFTRLSQHSNHSHWFADIATVTLEHYPDRESVLKAETQAILTEKPAHNINHNKPTRLDVIPDDVDESPLQKSEFDLYSQVVSFKPVMTLAAVKEITGISTPFLKFLIDYNVIGHVVMGSKVYMDEIRPKVSITGWQLIEFLDALQRGDIDMSALNTEYHKSRVEKAQRPTPITGP